MAEEGSGAAVAAVAVVVEGSGAVAAAVAVVVEGLGAADWAEAASWHRKTR